MITAFVANAIIRDEASGFAPIVRATHVTKTQIVLGRFAGGLTVALLGFAALHIDPYNFRIDRIDRIDRISDGNVKKVTVNGN